MYGLKLQKCVDMSKFGDLINIIDEFDKFVSSGINFGYFISYDIQNNTATIKVECASNDIYEIIDLDNKMCQIDSNMDRIGFDVN